MVQATSVNGRVGGITIGSGATLQAGNNANLFISKPATGTTLTNNGDLRTNASGGFTSDLFLDGDVTLGAAARSRCRTAVRGYARTPRAC